MAPPAPGLRYWFDAASDQPEAQRAAWLAQHCTDPQLRERVWRLLLAQARTVDPLAVQPGERLAALDADPSTVPVERQRIGDFRLIRAVGQGGMATVYLAERSGFAQRVAVKLLHRTVRSDLDRRLFERERKALASLEHPNIARLIDGGVSENDEPFLVMEFVEGLSITAFARAHALGPAARVRLLAEVCDAVATAHAQLIVHRDIKPANVLVRADGRCKLLDFGVAKFLEEDEDLTQRGMSGFTPDYAAPEQLDHRTVSTATDVYALGAMALELLVGSRERTLRTIRPSQAARQLASTTTGTGLTQRSLARYLRGDLDNILQKCLCDEPQRRYQSAQALADDLRRFLANQPVSAHPPSRWYLLRKFARRHRGGVIVTMVLVMATLASLALALWLGQQARMQAQRAEQAAAQAEEERLHALAALRVSESVQDFLVGLFEAAVPSVPQEQEPSVRDLVLRAEQKVETELGDVPDAAAEMYRRLAQIYSTIGDQAQAATLSARSVAFARQHLDPNGAVFRRVLFADARLRERAGAPQALADMERIVAATPVQDRGIDATYHRVTLGVVLSQHARGPEGIAMLTGALPMLEENCQRIPDACRLWATALTNLAAAQIAAREHALAAEHAAHALELSRTHNGEMHRQTAMALGNLGMAEFYLGRFREAQEHTEQGIDLLQRIEGPAGGSANILRQTLAHLFGASGRKLRSIAVHREVIGQLDRQSAAGFGSAAFRLNYARELLEAGHYDEAEAQTELLGPLWVAEPAGNPGNHARWFEVRAVIAAERDQRPAAALAQIDQALAIRRAQQPLSLQEWIPTLLTAHRIAARGGLPEEAARYLEEATTLIASLPRVLPALARAWSLRQAELALQGGDAKSTRQWLERLEQQLGSERPDMYADWAGLLRWQLALKERQPVSLPADWLMDLRQRWGEMAPIVRQAESLSQPRAADTRAPTAPAPLR